MGALETNQEEFYSSEVLAPWQDPGPGGCLESALMIPSAGFAHGLPIAHQSPGTWAAFVITSHCGNSNAHTHKHSCVLCLFQLCCGAWVL